MTAEETLLFAVPPKLGKSLRSNAVVPLGVPPAPDEEGVPVSLPKPFPSEPLNPPAPSKRSETPDCWLPLNMPRLILIEAPLLTPLLPFTKDETGKDLFVDSWKQRPKSVREEEESNAG